jgi:REP element-mobilizing transposase RayT
MIHGKLHHKTPGWVPEGERFHIRMSIKSDGLCLTTKELAPRLLESACFYHQHRRWYARLFLLMPDHLHAILSFPRDSSMSRVVGEWKKYHARQSHVDWQDNYFDHRLRNDEEFIEKAHYIRMNPVRKGLATRPEDWPWIVEPWKMDARNERYAPS